MRFVLWCLAGIAASFVAVVAMGLRDLAQDPYWVER